MTITPRQLGDRLRHAREACALSPAHASAHLAISIATLAAIEAGRRSPTGHELEALAYIYGQRSCDLVAPDGAPIDHSNHRLRGTAPADVIDAERKRIAIAHALADLERLATSVDTPPASPSDRLLFHASVALRDDLISPARHAELVRLAALDSRDGSRTTR